SFVGLAILLSLAARTQVLTPPRPCCATNDYICASAICPLWVIYRYSGALPSPDAGQCPPRTERLSSPPSCLVNRITHAPSPRTAGPGRHPQGHALCLCLWRRCGLRRSAALQFARARERLPRPGGTG